MTEKFIKKNNIYPFFIVNVFFLKQVISALMIAVNLLYFSSIHHFLFTCIFNESIYDTLMPLKKKKLWATCTFFLFCFVHFKFYCFDYNGLKKALSWKQSQTVCYKFLFFHKDLICLFKKSILHCMWRGLGMSLALH